MALFGIWAVGSEPESTELTLERRQALEDEILWHSVIYDAWKECVSSMNVSPFPVGQDELGMTWDEYYQEYFTGIDNSRRLEYKSLFPPPVLEAYFSDQSDCLGVFPAQNYLYFSSWPQFFLASPGPDGDMDIVLNMLDVRVDNELTGLAYGDKRRIYYKFMPPPYDVVYDPTNGLVSNGDLVSYDNIDRTYERWLHEHYKESLFDGDRYKELRECWQKGPTPIELEAIERQIFVHSMVWEINDMVLGSTTSFPYAKTDQDGAKYTLALVEDFRIERNLDLFLRQKGGYPFEVWDTWVIHGDGEMAGNPGCLPDVLEHNYHYVRYSKDWAFMFWSRGPDGDFDIQLEDIELQLRDETKPFSESNYVKFNNPPIDAYYDPTNGLLSDGDMISLATDHLYAPWNYNRYKSWLFQAEAYRRYRDCWEANRNPTRYKRE